MSPVGPADPGDRPRPPGPSRAAGLRTTSISGSGSCRHSSPTARPSSSGSRGVHAAAGGRDGGAGDLPPVIPAAPAGHIRPVPLLCSGALAADPDLAAVGAVGVPDGGAGVAGEPKPPSWTAVWCRSQSRAPFSQLVGPPWAQWTTWWTSHQAARGGAAGEHAVPVAQLHGPADRGGRGALLLADVQRQPGRVGQDPHHPGVAGQPAGGLGGRSGRRRPARRRPPRGRRVRRTARTSRW